MHTPPVTAARRRRQLARRLPFSPCPRLKAYRKWLTMEEPNWSDNRYPRIDYQDLSYYSAPKVVDKKTSLDEVRGRCSRVCLGVWWEVQPVRCRPLLAAVVAAPPPSSGRQARLLPLPAAAWPLQPQPHAHPLLPVPVPPVPPVPPPVPPVPPQVDPELLATFDKLGIPLNEQKRLANVAVDAVFDSVSIATTFKEELGKVGCVGVCMCDVCVMCVCVCMCVRYELGQGREGAPVKGPRWKEGGGVGLVGGEAGCATRCASA